MCRLTGGTRLTPATASVVIIIFATNAAIWQFVYLSFVDKSCGKYDSDSVIKPNIQRYVGIKRQIQTTYKRQIHETNWQGRQQQDDDRLRPVEQRQSVLPSFASMPQVPTAARCLQNVQTLTSICSALSSNGIMANQSISVNKTALEIFASEARAVYACQHQQLKELLLRQNCSDLRHQRGYGRWPLAREELNFPLAFSFKLHKDPDMFERLLSVLWRPHNLYVIHVDRKATEETYHAIRMIASCFDNVILTATRLDVVYASIVSLQADIVCVQEALKSSVPWRYHLSMSGQEFPLKNNLEMVQILRLLNGSNDIESYSPTTSIPFLNVLLYKAEIVNGTVLLTSHQRTQASLPQVEIRKGSAYNTVSREFLQWALQDPQSQNLLQWLNDTWAADELFWATVSFFPNAPGSVGVTIRHSTGTHLSRAVIWQWDSARCHGTFLRYVCVFAALDLPWLLARPELIANKFDPAADALVLECLQLQLERRAVRGQWEVTNGNPESPRAREANGRGVTQLGRRAKEDAGRDSATQGWKREGEFKLAPSLGERWPSVQERGQISGGSITDFVPVSSLNWTFYKSLPHVRYRHRDGW